MEDENENNSLSDLSESSQKKETQIQSQAKSQNQNKKSKSERKKKEEAEQFDKVKNVWNSHSDWLRHSGYAQPQVVESIFPQFFADIKDRENLRIAQMFCLPMAAMKEMSYSETILVQ